MVSEKLSKKKLKEILNRRNFIIVVLIFFFVSMYMQINKLIDQFVYLYERDSSLVAEIGQLKDTYLEDFDKQYLDDIEKILDELSIGINTNSSKKIQNIINKLKN